jgi:predicted transcriptional regulator
MDVKTLLGMTTDIVSAHASSNELTQEQLLGEIQNVFAKLAALSGGPAVACVAIEQAGPEAGLPKPAVPLEAAFGADKVFCMVCGQGMKTLKRHLSTSHGLKPGQYRKQFNVPAGTPLVAKNYSEARKQMALEKNLGAGLAKARAARATAPAKRAKAAKK